MSDESAKKKALLDKIKKYRHVLTNGCGNWRCTNPNCLITTKTKLSDRAASLRAVELLKSKAPLCDGFDPLPMTPLLPSELTHLRRRDDDDDLKNDDDDDDEQQMEQGINNNNGNEEKSDAFVRELEIVKSAFEHPEILELSFLTGDKVSEENPEINLMDLDVVFGMLVERESTCEVATDAIVNGMKVLDDEKEMSLDQLRSVLILFENPLIVSEDPSKYDLLNSLLSIVHKLSESKRNILRKWLSKYDDLSRIERIIFCLQQCITIKLLECEEIVGSTMDDIDIDIPEEIDEDEIEQYRSHHLARLEHRERTRHLSSNEMTCLFEVMQLFFESNNMIKHEFDTNGYVASMNTRTYLPRSIFYNDCISNDLFGAGTIRAVRMLVYDYISWRQGGGFSYLNYPFLLNAATKASYIGTNNDLKRRANPLERILGLRPPLRLEVHRANLIPSTLVWLQQYDESDYQQQLVVKFSGEDGVDEGGVRKEFFQLLIEQLFDVQFGMFELNEVTQTFWFNKISFETSEEYKLIGILLGLSLYNNVILDLRFPKVVFKKLLGKPLMFEDFIDFDPDMANGLVALMNYDDDDLSDVFCRTFSVEYEYFGGTRVDELKPGGQEIELTMENREEYVNLYIDYMLERSVNDQFSAFKRGFDLVCSGQHIRKLLSIISAEELELLICGSHEFDFDELEGSARYEDGFTKESRTVIEFWEIVHQFSEDDKRKLLQFCTGSDRVPVRGLKDLRLTISKNGNDDDRLPTSHTCFNHLLLPEYSTKEVLYARLQTAIQNSQGFGLI